MTKLRGIQQRRGFRVAIIFALACVAVAVVGKTVVAGDAPLFTGLRNEQQIRADSQKQFREIHSDATGRYRPDLLNKGIAQAQRLPISSTWRGAASVKGSALANPSAASAVKRDHRCAVGAVRPRAVAHRCRAELPGHRPRRGHDHRARDRSPGDDRPGRLPVQQRRRHLEDDGQRCALDADDRLHAVELDGRRHARCGQPVDRLRRHRQPLQQRLLQPHRCLPLGRRRPERGRTSPSPSSEPAGSTE